MFQAILTAVEDSFGQKRVGVIVLHSKRRQLIFAYGNLPQHSEWPETYSEDLRFEERIILDRGIPFLPPISVKTEVQ